MKVWVRSEELWDSAKNIYFELWTHKPGYQESVFVTPLRDNEVSEFSAYQLIMRIFAKSEVFARSTLNIKLHRR